MWRCVTAVCLQGSVIGARRRLTVSHTPTHVHTHGHTPSSKAGFESLGLEPEPNFKKLPQVGLQGVGEKRYHEEKLRPSAWSTLPPSPRLSLGWGLGGCRPLPFLPRWANSGPSWAGWWRPYLRMPLTPPSISSFPLFGSG